MTAEQYKRVKQIFQAATALPADAHAAFLDKECGDDGPLRREVDSLLEHHYRNTQLLEDPAPDLRSSKLMPPGEEEIDHLVSGELEAELGVAMQQGRFRPGTKIAERYQIVELLGMGGMGEVYRADDLTLSQSVALKFLPPVFSSNPRWLARFHNEVRFARQVSHPNVCRVFDIGEYAGEQFISMEYVDGEDLASLGRRIGRLPQDKCIQIARQLCSGLAAAHDKGLLHRDLKPANVMVDGRGNVRITDFGLAAPVDQLQGRELRAGTPAYMSPEQLVGKEITVRSDIYSLGLVLYEIFTGRQTFEAGSFPEYVRLHQHERPKNPSVFFDQIDPTIETVILRCLEKNPAKRFASAIAVAAALPGGDPMAAALAAGETPSPEMVAAAGGTSGLKAPMALTLLAVVAAGLLAILLLARQSDFLNRPALHLDENPPVVLQKEASDIVKTLGYHKEPEFQEKATDTANGYAVDYDYYQYVQKHPAPDSWEQLSSGDPGPIYFWYRESPKYLVTPTAVVGELDPPVTVPDMVRIELDPTGKLLEFEAVPKASIPPPAPATMTAETPGTLPAAAPPIQVPPSAKPVEWSQLFKAADLNMDDFKPASPTLTPPDFADIQMAWTPRDTDREDLPQRVEAAGFQGRATFFKLKHYHWDIHPKGETNLDLLASSNLSGNATVRVALILTMLVVALVLAFINISSGRADRNGAMRLAVFFTTTGLLAWAFRAHHVAGFLPEFFQFRDAMGEVLFPSLLVWAYYLALEPYVRRIWPETLISWSRLLSGRVLDPLIGRHAIVGSVAGVVCVLLFQLEKVLPPLLHLVHPLPVLFRRVDMLTVSPLSTVLTYVHNSLYFALLQLLLLVLLLTVLRKRFLAAIGFVIVVTFATTVLVPGAYVAWAVEALISVICMVLLIRFGLVSLVACLLIFLMLTNVPLTPNLGAWYSNISMYAVAAVLATAAGAAYVAIASRSTFRVAGLTKTNA